MKEFTNFPRHVAIGGDWNLKEQFYSRVFSSCVLRVQIAFYTLGPSKVVCNAGQVVQKAYFI